LVSDQVKLPCHCVSRALHFLIAAGNQNLKATMSPQQKKKNEKKKERKEKIA
jgi:hypothetical protein